MWWRRVQVAGQMCGWVGGTDARLAALGTDHAALASSSHACRSAIPCQSQAHEALAEAQEAAEGLREQLRAALTRAEGAELSAAALKRQVAEAQKEVDARERRLQVGGAWVGA